MFLFKCVSFYVNLEKNFALKGMSLTCVYHFTNTSYEVEIFIKRQILHNHLNLCRNLMLKYNRDYRLCRLAYWPITWNGLTLLTEVKIFTSGS